MNLVVFLGWGGGAGGGKGRREQSPTGSASWDGAVFRGFRALPTPPLHSSHGGGGFGVLQSSASLSLIVLYDMQVPPPPQGEGFQEGGHVQRQGLLRAGQEAS